MFETSASTEKLDAALAKAQGQIRAALKDSKNDFFKSSYADLPAVWAACQGPLTENGISVTQWPCHSEDNRLHIVTRLACGGEWMRAEFSIPVAKQDPQGFGSAVTYARRFALAAAVGVVADADDDGNAASGNGKGETSTRKPAARAQNVPAAARAEPPSSAAPPPGATSETDEQKQISRWTDAMKACHTELELRAVGKRISEDRSLSQLVQADVNARYKALMADLRKPKKPGPCGNCGDVQHSAINCPDLSNEERAEILRLSATSGTGATQ